jgi:RNase H-like domain found in reverse transcriptase/Integrase zinc binding domain
LIQSLIAPQISGLRLPNSASKIQSVINTAIKRNENYKTFCPVKLDDVFTYALIDSGNLVTNAISEKFAIKIFGPQFSNNLKPVSTTIGTAKRGEEGALDILGRVRHNMTLRLGGTGLTFKTKPLVIRDFNSDLNIGSPFMAKHQIDQLHSDGCLLVNGQRVRLFSSQQQKDQDLDEKNLLISSIGVKQKKLISSRAYIAKTIEIPPRTASFIQVRVPGVEKREILPGPGILSVSPTFAGKCAAHPVNLAAVETDSSGQSYTSLLNSGNEPIIVREGHFFGTFEPHSLNQVVQTPVSSKGISPLSLESLNEKFCLEESPLLKKNPVVRRQILGILQKYSDLFHPQTPVLKNIGIAHSIPTQEVPPIRCKGKPLNPIMQERFRKQMDKWKQLDLIEPSSSPWSFGLLPVPKKNGDTQWVVDYRRLNDVTIKKDHAIPDLRSQLDILSSSKIFSEIKGSLPHYSLPLEKADREKTAFHTPFGLWQFKKTPLGLCQTNETYSRLVKKALEDLPAEVALPYLGDTCIHSSSIAEHLSSLEQTFKAYRKAGLLLSPADCKLFQTEIRRGGYLIDSTGLKPDPGHVDIIKSWPVPTDLQGLRNFLIKTDYYKAFIQHYSILSNPLREIAKRDYKANPSDKPFKLSDSEKQAFFLLRAALSESPLLSHADFSSDSPFILDTDWSADPGAIGGILSQVQNGEERVICYGARKLTKQEKNYSSNKGELLAATHFMTEWKHYLRPRPFILRTDHQALKWIRTMEEPKGMILQWLETLGENNFTVQFRDGKKHGNADALSRSSHARDPTRQEEDAANEEAIMSLQPDETPLPPLISPYELNRLQEADPDLRKVRKWIKTGQRPDRSALSKESRDLQQYHCLFLSLYLDDNQVLHRRSYDNEFFQHDRICLPQYLQRTLTQTYHEAMEEHPSIEETQAQMAKLFYFPELLNTTYQALQQCEKCHQEKRFPHQECNGYLGEEVIITVFGPVREQQKPNKIFKTSYVLTSEDRSTRWIEATILSELSSKSVKTNLQLHYRGFNGNPRRVRIRAPTAQLEKLVKDASKEMGVMESETLNSKLGPSQVRLRSVLQRLKQEGAVLTESLPAALLAVRSTRCSYGITPHWAVYGREAPIPVNLIHPTPGSVKGQENLTELAFSHLRKHHQADVERSRDNYNGDLDGCPLQLGNLVWLIQHQETPQGSPYGWSGPWKVIDLITDLTLRLKTQGTWNDQELQIVTTIDRVQRYTTGTTNRSVDRMELRLSDLLTADEFWEQISGLPIGSEKDLFEEPPLGTHTGSGPTAIPPVPPENNQPEELPPEPDHSADDPPQDAGGTKPPRPPYPWEPLGKRPLPDGDEREEKAARHHSPESDSRDWYPDSDTPESPENITIEEGTPPEEKPLPMSPENEESPMDSTKDWLYIPPDDGGDPSAPADVPSEAKDTGEETPPVLPPRISLSDFPPPPQVERLSKPQDIPPPSFALKSRTTLFPGIRRLFSPRSMERLTETSPERSSSTRKPVLLSNNAPPLMPTRTGPPPPIRGLSNNAPPLDPAGIGPVPPIRGLVNNAPPLPKALVMGPPLRMLENTTPPLPKPLVKYVPDPRGLVSNAPPLPKSAPKTTPPPRVLESNVPATSGLKIAPMKETNATSPGVTKQRLEKLLTDLGVLPLPKVMLDAFHSPGQSLRAGAALEAQGLLPDRTHGTSTAATGAIPKSRPVAPPPSAEPVMTPAPSIGRNIVDPPLQPPAGFADAPSAQNKNKGNFQRKLNKLARASKRPLFNTSPLRKKVVPIKRRPPPPPTPVASRPPAPSPPRGASDPSQTEEETRE